MMLGQQRQHSLRIDTGIQSTQDSSPDAVTPHTRTTSTIHNDNATSITKHNNIKNDSNNTEQDAGAPSPWRYSTSRGKVIVDLKDRSSDIHLHIGTYGPRNWKQVEFQPLWENYVNRYSLSNFTSNLKRLLFHFQSETGVFEDETAKIESWYTSISNVSKAYSLLFLLYMDSNDSSVINNMTAEEIWESHPQFQQYELDKFKTYSKNMKALTNKKKHCIREDEATLRRDMLGNSKMCKDK